MKGGDSMNKDEKTVIWNLVWNVVLFFVKKFKNKHGIEKTKHKLEKIQKDIEE